MHASRDPGGDHRVATFSVYLSSGDTGRGVLSHIAGVGEGRESLWYSRVILSAGQRFFHGSGSRFCKAV